MSDKSTGNNSGADNTSLGKNAAVKKECKVITLSGFAPENPLSKMGDVRFYVPSDAYSHVEIVHHTIIHYMLDMIMERKKV